MAYGFSGFGFALTGFSTPQSTGGSSGGGWFGQWCGTTHTGNWWGSLYTVVEPPVVVPTPGGGYQFVFADKRSRILREDEDIVAFLASVLQSGLLH